MNFKILKSRSERRKIDKEIAALEREIEDVERSQRLLSWTLAIASTLNDTMVAVAAGRIGDDQLAIESLSRGAVSMKAAIEGLRTEYEHEGDVTKRWKEALDAIKVRLDG